MTPMETQGRPNPRQQFEHKLEGVQQDVLRMGSVVEQMLHTSMEAYRRREPSLVQEVLRLDDVVDQFNLDIEKNCLQLLALQNPMARDLRVIAASLKIITDVERIGDYCIDIARTASLSFDAPAMPPAQELTTMAEIANTMLHETLQAFVSRDLDLVRQMIAHDDQVDGLYRSIHDGMVAKVREAPDTAAQAVAVIMIARYLERIADHVTNVGERVYYMETGEYKELHQ